ncbi:MAG: hypothetical protein AMXMBFR64_19000 [Myxococcales bacterium]
MTARLVPLLIALAGVALPALIQAKTRITLDGVEHEAFWSDGDSFRITQGPEKGLKSRIAQFNTLESYGPVHRWGTWTREELAGLAKKATNLVRSRDWECETVKKDGEPIKDHYGRALIRCPGAAKALIEAGLAHVFFVDEGDADQELIEAQHAAQKAGAGMWAKGVPATILTSVHSADEPNSDKPYNRVTDTITGLSRKIFHDKTYPRCTEACEGDSCLLYVPFNERYGKKRAECLLWGGARPPIPTPVEQAPVPPAPRAPVETSPAPAQGDADEVL